MKENTPEQQLDLLCSQIIRERDHWNYINENGCNDPFWPDGSNINLTRSLTMKSASKSHTERLC